jgi:inner membrane protein
MSDLPPKPEEQFTLNFKKIRHSVTFKLFSMLFLLLLAMIPVAFVQALVNERQGLQREAEREVNQKWADQQTLQGPVLTVPYDQITVSTEEKGKKKTVKTRRFMHVLPETLKITGQLEPQKLHRGIYDIVVYSSALNLQGHFDTTLLKNMSVPDENIHWSQAFISLGLSDLRGIEASIVMQWAGANKVFDPGTVTDHLFEKGVHVPVALAAKTLSKNVPFALDLKLKGNQRLFFAPVGKETEVQLKAPWGSPSFDGAFLPTERTVSETHFEARWKVLHLNRNYPQFWENAQYKFEDSYFGVYLIEPVDHYHKVERSVKYALFFIGLTFLTFFFVEVITKRLVHPLQYLLVGFALSVFYTLLLSISEQIGFDKAYGIAAVMTVGLITAYAAGFLKSRRLTLAMGSILTTLYTFIYIIIYQQDYALLMGSLGLFLVLALVMFFSRKLDLGNDELLDE